MYLHMALQVHLKQLQVVLSETNLGLVCRAFDIENRKTPV